jgi:hypothetical protein
MSKSKETFMRLSALISCAALLAAATFANTVQAQSFTTHPCTDGDDTGGTISHWLGGSDQACEVRSANVPLVNGHLDVNGQNGGIDVIGEDRQDIALEAHVTARAGSKSDAESLLHEITIETGATIQAKGPRPAGNRNWSVSYKLLVPHHLAANFHTNNGGISLTGLNGDIRADTTNGGLRLDNLAGEVHANTTNGGIHANLSGPTWQGSGLYAQTTNGGVSVSASHPYSAHLIASTVNGGISAPGVSESGGRHKSVDTNLGSGGPTIKFETVNGGVSIN